MAGSSYGLEFRVTTFGESHGKAIGVIVDGVTPGLELSVDDIQPHLARRRPGQSHITTPRDEADRVEILSGVFEGKTTGTPITLVVFNQDQRSKDYGDIMKKFRPGHADATYLNKYGLRDYRGSGRASGRETIGRVAAGAIALKLLSQKGITVTAYTRRAAGVECKTIDFDVIEQNPVRAADAEAAAEMVRRIEKLAEEGNSTGGIVECVVQGLPAGLGEPVFDKLDAEIAKAMLSLGAVKGIEFGDGFAAADMTGVEHNDEIAAGGHLTNSAGGVLGGISSGEDLTFRIVVKPPASIKAEQKTVDVEGRETTISTHGRHDPIICPRIVPVVESMAAIAILDLLKRHAALLA